MNMTAELVQRMKAAAQEATQGEWRWEGDGGFSYLLAEGDTSPENRIIDDGSAWGEYAETISPDSFDAAHIATSCPQNVLALVEALEAAEKRGTDMEVACELFAESKLAQIKLEAALEKAQQRIAELEARDVKPVAWMRSANVTSFMSRFTTDENYAVEQWGDDAVALYSLPVAFIPACFTDERNLMHINERGRATSLIWSEHNSDSGDIKLFRIAAAAGKGE